MRTAETNPEGYAYTSFVKRAKDLSGRLLLVFGSYDDNVHPQNTVQMSGALIKAGLPVEQAFYPGQKHGFRPAELRHFYARATDFFVRELQGREGNVEVRAAGGGG